MRVNVTTLAAKTLGLVATGVVLLTIQGCVPDSGVLQTFALGFLRELTAAMLL